VILAALTCAYLIYLLGKVLPTFSVCVDLQHAVSEFVNCVAIYFNGAACFADTEKKTLKIWEKKALN
jgi:hypothetical protein